MYEQHVTVGEGGRLVIPAVYRKQLDIHPGDELIMRLQDGELRVFQQHHALQRIQQAVKSQHTVAKATDHFINFRKHDAGKE